MIFLRNWRALCATSMAALIALSSGKASACTALMIIDANGVAYSGKTMEFSEPLPLATSLPLPPSGTPLVPDGPLPEDVLPPPTIPAAAFATSVAAFVTSEMTWATSFAADMSRKISGVVNAFNAAAVAGSGATGTVCIWTTGVGNCVGVVPAGG